MIEVISFPFVIIIINYLFIFDFQVVLLRFLFPKQLQEQKILFVYWGDRVLSGYKMILFSYFI